LVEAYLSLHFPIVSEGGLDLKLGKFVTLEGAETIDPHTDFFYSHTYIFNFGIPFNHTGALATFHATKWLDLMAGVTRGVNTSIDDNNVEVAEIVIVVRCFRSDVRGRGHNNFTIVEI
jgi:hypothetical protein